MTAAPRPNNKLEKKYYVSMDARGEGGERRTHVALSRHRRRRDGRVDAFLIVRYVSTLRRARVACAHAFMHRIITRR